MSNKTIKIKIPKYDVNEFVQLKILISKCFYTKNSLKIVLDHQVLFGVVIPKGFETWVKTTEVDKVFKTCCVSGSEANEIIRTVIFDKIRSEK